MGSLICDILILVLSSYNPTGFELYIGFVIGIYTFNKLVL